MNGLQVGLLLDPLRITVPVREVPLRSARSRAGVIPTRFMLDFGPHRYRIYSDTRRASGHHFVTISGTRYAVTEMIP